MSVIAWDGTTLAADRRACAGTQVRTIRKVRKIRGHLIGFAGCAASAAEIIAWFADGADPDKYPDHQRGSDRDGWASLLVIRPDGNIDKYESGPHPISFPPQIFAIGSGGDFALAAMHLGRSAVDAVAVASELDSGCGNGSDSITHGSRDD